MTQATKKYNPSHCITHHVSQVSTNERALLLGQQARTIWLTGLSASGKSTLAFALEKALINAGRVCYVLDGDNVRHGLNSDLGFMPADRSENIRRIAEVAKLMNEAGLIVITAFISPIQTDRAMAKEIIGETKFREVYVSTPLMACEARDPKGLYAKARKGEITNFTGISAQYEAPNAPHLTLDTASASLRDHLKQLLSLCN